MAEDAMAENMVRTQVYLPQATYKALIERAKKQGLTMATQIRAALDEYLQRTQTEDDEDGPVLQPDDPIFEMIGSGDSGLPDVAVNHDHYLYGTSKRYPVTGEFIREAANPTDKFRARRPARRRKSAR
jgi:hypothetical protein